MFLHHPPQAQNVTRESPRKGALCLKTMDFIFFKLLTYNPQTSLLELLINLSDLSLVADINKIV